MQDLVCQIRAVLGQNDRVERLQLFPAAIAVQSTCRIQPAVRCTAHVIVAVTDHQHPLALHHGLGEHITDNGGLGVPALVHGSAADKIKILCQALLFQNGGHDPRRLGRSRAEDEPGLFQAAEHLRHAREDGTLVAAFLMVACTVALCRLLNFCLVAEVLAKALAERRAQIAAEVDIRGIHTHGVEDFF